MAERKNIIQNFSNIEDYINMNNDLLINKTNHQKKASNSIDISNTEIDLSLKKLSQINLGNNSKKTNHKKIKLSKINSLDISKNIKNDSIITLPYTLSSSKRKAKYFPDLKKNSWKKKFNKENGSHDIYIKYSTESNKNKIDINSLLDKKIISKDHSFHRTYYKKIDSKNSKKLSIDYYNAFQCIFCEQIFKENEISKLIKCGHKFCNNCGEKFYLDLVNQEFGNQNFKCPFFKCDKEIPYMVLELLFQKNYDTLRINQSKQENEIVTNRNFISIRENLNDIIESNIINNNIKKRNNKLLEAKNILDINNISGNYIFYLQYKNNLILCPKCGQNALYKNASKYFLKCLYCKKKFCKFCVKLLTENHFNKDNIHRCRVYFRINKFYKKNFCLKFIKQLFLVIAGYLFLISFFINKIKNIYHTKNEYSIISIITISFFYIFVFIINIPFFIVIIPYYPILSCL